MMDKFNRESLKLAELKYYDHKHNGIEVSEPLSFVVLVQIGDRYFNALDPIEELPTFERVPGTTNSYDDDYFGTKVRLITDGCSTGPCWLISTEYDVKKKFAGEVVTKRELEDYVLWSPLFFKDRIDIAKDRLSKFEQPYRMATIIGRERHRIDEIQAFYRARMSDLSREFIKTDKK